ncbi:amidase signature enzyme [Mycena olivaceomarginata]|nr:amidase signature enzyme [Mycena olivaceomarginata]
MAMWHGACRCCCGRSATFCQNGELITAITGLYLDGRGENSPLRRANVLLFLSFCPLASSSAVMLLRSFFAVALALQSVLSFLHTESRCSYFPRPLRGNHRRPSGGPRRGPTLQAYFARINEVNRELHALAADLDDTAVVPGDATVTAKLRQAGAIILGKTNMSEWAGFGPLAPGDKLQVPYYPKGSACGSSSGSGVAAAIGLAAATLGTETAGTYNNVVGLVPASQHQDTVGPLVRTVTDAAISPLCHRWQKTSADNYTNAQPDSVPDYTAVLNKDALKGARLGVPRAVFLDTKYGPVPGAAAFTAALKTMKDLGAILTDPADIVLNTDLKVDIQAYLATLKEIPTNVHTVADIAAFNDAHKDLEEPALDAYVEYNLYFGLAETAQVNDAYLQAVQTDRDLAAQSRCVSVPMSGFMYVLAGIVTVPLGFQANDTAPADAGGKDEPLETAPGIPLASLSKLLAFAYAYEQATQTRLKRKAYEAATPKTQLADVVGKNSTTTGGGNSTITGSDGAPSGTTTGAATSISMSQGLLFVFASLVFVQGFFG